MMTIAKKSLPLSLGKGRIPAYGLQGYRPRAPAPWQLGPMLDDLRCMEAAMLAVQAERRASR